jgi:hypothetical protein
MEQKVRRELDDMLLMVANWRADMERIAGNEEGWGFLVRDLAGEIEEHIYPYLRRLHECKHIDEKEGGEFLVQCFEHVRLMAEHLCPAEEEARDGNG